MDINKRESQENIKGLPPPSPKGSPHHNPIVLIKRRNTRTFEKKRSSLNLSICQKLHEDSPVLRVIKREDTVYAEYNAVKENCVYEGLAKKEGGSVKSWKLRWFVLTPRHLLYFIPNNGPPEGNALPLGVINISSIKSPEGIIELPKDNKLSKQHKDSRYRFCLETPIKGKRLFHMRVVTQQVCQYWIKLLKVQVYRVLETPIAGEEKGIRSEDFLSKKYVWYENFDKVKSKTHEKEIENLKFEDSIEVVSRRPSYITYCTSREKIIFKEEEELEQIIESISEKHELHNIISLIKDNLEDQPKLRQIFFAVLEPKLLLPFQILVAEYTRSTNLPNSKNRPGPSPSFSSPSLIPNKDLALTKPLDGVIKAIQVLLESFPSESPVVDYFHWLRKYYTTEVEKINVFGTKLLKPPVLIQGSQNSFGRRILYSQAARGILREGRDNKYGLHAVIAYSSIHWKKTPGSPGYEFAVNRLYKLVVGHGTAPSRLLKITRFKEDGKSEDLNILASKTVNGVLLKTILEEKPHLISKIDPQDFSCAFLMSLLINVQDGKADNYIATLNTTTNLLQIVGIDNDHAFSDTLCRHNQGHTVNVRNIFFFLPQADHTLNQEAKQIFMNLSPFLVVMCWLLHLHKGNLEYEEMKKDGLLTELDYKEMSLPIMLRKGMVTTLCRKFIILRELLLTDTTNFLTHNDIFRYLHPDIYAINRVLLENIKPEKPDQGYTAFRHLFKMPVIETDPILKQLLNKELPILGDDSTPRPTLSDVLHQGTKPTIHDYVKQRTMRISDAMTELISVMEFDKCPSGEEQYLYDVVFPTVPLTGSLKFQRPTKFRSHHFEKLVATSPHLKSIQLIGCDRIRSETFKILLNIKNPPIIYVHNCKRLTPKVISALKKEGISIFESKRKFSTLFSPSELNFFFSKQYLPPIVVLKIIKHFENREITNGYSALCSLEEQIFEHHKQLIIGRAISNEVLHNAVLQSQPEDIVEGLIRILGLDVNAWDLNCCAPLHLAARIGDTKMCSILLRMGTNLEQKGQLGRTPLQEALYHGQEGVAQIFFNHNAKYHHLAIMEDSDEYNVLHLATAKALGKVAMYLIDDMKMDIHELTTLGKKNLLHLAGENNVDDPEFLKFLLNHGANPFINDNNKTTPMLSAAKGGNTTLAKLLLNTVSDPRAYIKLTNKDSRNILHVAVEQLVANPKTVREFMSPFLVRFPNLAEMTDLLNRTPMNYAAKFGNAEAIAVLLEAGVSPLKCDTGGNTPLHHVIELDDWDSARSCLKLLIDYEDRVTNPDNKLLEVKNQAGLTPLGRCILLLYKNTDLRQYILRKLIKHGASMKNCIETESKKTTILHQAIRRGALQPVAYLLDNGVSVRLSDSHLNTPLHEACTKGHYEIVKLIQIALMKECVSEKEQIKFLNQKNKDGDTAMMLAIQGPKMHYEIVKELLMYGCESIENAKGESPIDVAKKRNLKAVEEILIEVVLKTHVENKL